MSTQKQISVPHEYYNIPSEAAVIASLLSADASQAHIEVGKTADILSVDDFYDLRHQIIYAEIIRRFEKADSLDPISILTSIRANGDILRIGGVEYVKNILAPDNLYYLQNDVTVYARHVLEESRRRRLWILGKELQTYSSPESGLTVAEAITTAEGAVRAIADSTVKTEAANVKEFSGNLLEEIRLRKEIPEGATVGIPSGFVDLDIKTSGWKPGQFIIVAARPAMGKALALDTKIPTPDGWKYMGEISVGDKVYSPSGEAINVVATTEIMYERECYRVSFSDGTNIVADGQHEWGIGAGDLVEITTTEEMFNSFLQKSNLRLELPGHLSVASSLGGEATSVDIETEVYTAVVRGEVPNIDTPWALPFELRRNIIKDASRALKDYEETNDYYIDDALAIESWIRSLETSMGEHDKRLIVGVTKVMSTPVKCIQVDSEDHFYLAGNFIPTHNSTIALDFARTAAMVAKKSVVMFSLEMSKNELLEKIFSAEARVPTEALKSGKLDEEQWERIRAVQQQFEESNLIIDDSADSVTLSHIRTVLQRQKNRPEGLDMAIIDYIQLMSGSGAGRKSDNRQQEVSDLSRGLKLLAKELGIPIFGLSQLNRGPEQRQVKKPMVSDLRESGSLEQDADMVLLIHRPEVYDPEDNPGKAFLDIGKHRNGATGTIELISLLHISKFANAVGSYQQANYETEAANYHDDAPPPEDPIPDEVMQTPPSEADNGRGAW